MKHPVLHISFLAVVLTLAGTTVVAEDLDASLEAQKKKAARRVYSERAILADHNLTVPRPETEEERALDKKLRAMDAEADARPALSLMIQTPRPASVVPRLGEENNNWLAAAVLDASSPAAPDPDIEARQIEDQLSWHQRLKEKNSAENLDNTQTENDLRDRITTSQPGLPELDSLKKYQLNASGGLNTETKSSPDYLTPQDRSIDPLAAIRPAPKKETVTPALFSPEAARLSSATRPSSVISRPEPALPSTGIPARKSSSVFSYDPNQTGLTPQTSLNPLEQIRKASPINRPNPFAEDSMPTINRSIWD